MSLFARKSIDALRADALDDGEHGLHRALGPVNVISIGIGMIIGTGIFVLTGSAAAQYAGPALVLSFLVAAVACGFAGLCYAEFSAMIPSAGSAYTYAYATLGELLAWIIGWDLILEYLFAAATVAVGWSGYVVSLLRDMGITIPAQWAHAPGTELVQLPGASGWVEVTEQLTTELTTQGTDIAALPHATGMFNIVAVIGVLAVTALLVLGVRESARANNVMVVVKLAVILLFIGAGSWFLFGDLELARENWTPFIPPNGGEFGDFGWSGVLRAAGVIFFAYIGFDSVSTMAQETKQPQRDMPIGILGSLVICTILYILVTAILTALVPYAQLNVPEPIALGVEATGLMWLSGLVKVGAIAGLSSVMLVTLLAQPRVFFAMSRDGLLPPAFSRLHPRFRTPFVSTILTGVVCAFAAGALPLTLLGELVSIGTLLAFVIVCAGVWWLRVKEPERERPFRTPFVPWVPIAGILVCMTMMAGLPLDTWLRLVIWLAAGLVVYAFYGRHRSTLRVREAPAGGTTRATQSSM